MGVPKVPSGGKPLYEELDDVAYCTCNELSIKPREGIPYVSLMGGSPYESLDGTPYDSLGGTPYESFGGGGGYAGLDGEL